MGPIHFSFTGPLLKHAPRCGAGTPPQPLGTNHFRVYVLKSFCFSFAGAFDTLAGAFDFLPGTFERRSRWRTGVGRRPSTGPAFPNAIQRNKSKSKAENGASRRGTFERRSRWRTRVGRRPSTGPAFLNAIQRNKSKSKAENGASRRGTFERKTRRRTGVGRRPSTGPALPDVTQRNKPSGKPENGASFEGKPQPRGSTPEPDDSSDRPSQGYRGKPQAKGGKPPSPLSRGQKSRFHARQKKVKFIIKRIAGFTPLP